MSYENYDPCFPDQPVVDQYLPIWASLPSFRSKPAFIWAEDGSSGETQRSNLTYSQLNKSVESISTNLLFPLQRGDTVVILCPPGLELVEIIFGCQRAGIIAVPITPPNPSFANNGHHHFVRVLSQAKPKAAIAHSDYIQRVRRNISTNSQLCQLLKNLVWVSTEEIKDKNAELNPVFSSYNGIKPDEVYLIQYSSGATGVPKPVLVSAGSASHNVRTARKAYDLHPNSVIVSWLPQYHDCGLMFLLLTIVSGATCVLASPTAFIKRPRLWLELITECKATCTPVPSFTLPLVIKRGGMDKGTLDINLWSLNNLIIINEPIYKASVEHFIEVFKPYGLNPCSISPSYGLAENCTFVSTAWRGHCSNASLPTYNKLLPSARLACGEDEEIHILVVDAETHEAAEDGIEGEIWVSSPSNARGYLGHPSLTREVFQGRLRDRVSQCFVRTGDRGIVHGKERYLFVTGRSSDILTQNGRKIHPHYIESLAYESCPQFIRGGCIAAIKISREIAVVAEMQRSGGEIGVLKRICEGIREVVMKGEKIDVGVVVLVKSGSVPKTTSGKIQRWAAMDKLLEGKMSVIMQMQFDGDGGRDSKFVGETVHAWEGREKSGSGRKVVEEQRGGGIFFSLSKAPSHLSLLSSL
ncbi:Long-chain-fatty-acid--AMP ligase [Actinidia chinensis var. chinensis]|uniref:Long-chain-fatty-acid--AMP ligase n=1 Tax=Actinidia chinensis var. chinensis TaxID=1590841 RepID=A0A2R6PZV7_ACTCC|nr:Long-chain-fatty-acid--AMP ligase [Actinidia chinensis var. chinensis]